MPLDVLVQGGVFGHPPHLGQDKVLCEGLLAQGAPPLCCQHTVNELQAECEAVVVILVKPEENRQTQKEEL